VTELLIEATRLEEMVQEVEFYIYYLETTYDINTSAAKNSPEKQEPPSSKRGIYRQCLRVRIHWQSIRHHRIGFWHMEFRLPSCTNQSHS
jgi:hypothetical protein